MPPRAGGNLVLGMGMVGLGLVEIAAWCKARPRVMEALAALGKDVPPAPSTSQPPSALEGLLGVERFDSTIP